MKRTKCECDSPQMELEFYEESCGELWESGLLQEYDGPPSTLSIYSDCCIQTVHWSNREEGQHDDIFVICHYCAYQLKHNNGYTYTIEYQGDNWSETH